MEGSDEDKSANNWIYNDLLRRSQYSVECKRCKSLISVKYYQRHLAKFHKIKMFCVCIWCEQYKWKRGSSPIDNILHRIMCLRKCIIDNMCTSRYIFNCEPCNTWLNTLNKYKQYQLLRNQHDQYKFLLADVAIAFQWLSQIPINIINTPSCEVNDVQRMVWYNNVQIDGDKSGIFPQWIKLFYCFNKYFTWLDLIINYDEWDNFYMWISARQEYYCVLPHWCLCSGLHRHSIIVMFKHMITEFKVQYYYYFIF
ncbi:hypothetical protein GpSGHVEth133 [Glossina pallidipes salivary gland hypertrophy virus]|uniref:Uncharacterized protein n=2 Tax=Glossina hytrovirus (isolate Glossina pallidipes/Ethiopia/Seibersdorf/-) TaxID=379529 RepID=A0A0Y0JE48_GHVS|nr:hypothetical protein SGHV121 [Glossina pallidipes salivary gland hypertrophy virus]ABQ08894.1 hypothetical protein SGHV121 [Glossina pallidipes salivary gland hypertrophy virus]AMB48737.1 hypothetical protein GpSGHVEth133 [Glossina pallidipes salivary gland hypertrophy virus]